MAKKASLLDVVRGLTQKKGAKDKETEKYERILTENPDDRNALNALGDLYAKRGDSDKACEYYLQVGALYAKDGFTLKAIAVYKKAQRAKPNIVQTYLDLADLYVQKGLVGEAKTNYLAAAEMQAASGEKHASLDTYRKIADLDPDNIKIRSKLAAMYEGEDFPADAAIIYCDIGDVMISESVEKGRQYYQKALKLQPDNEDLLARVGYAYADADQRREAIEIFQTLLKLFPKNIDYREQIEQLSGSHPTPDLPASALPIEFSEEELSSLNFGEEAEAAPEHHIEVSPEEENADAHVLDFQIDQEQGAIQWEPEESFDGAPTAAPDSAAASQFFDLASRLETSIQGDQGAQAATGGVAQDAVSQPPNLKIEASEKLAIGEIDDIVKEFKQGVLEEVGVEDYETHYELGISYKEMSLLEDAIEELKLAALEPTKFVECQGVIALCYVEKENYSQAVLAFQEARAKVEQQGEKYQDLTYQIGNVYETWGKTVEAAQAFQELFQINPRYKDVKRRLNTLLG